LACLLVVFNPSYDSSNNLSCFTYAEVLFVSVSWFCSWQCYLIIFHAIPKFLSLHLHDSLCFGPGRGQPQAKDVALTYLLQKANHTKKYTNPQNENYTGKKNAVSFLVETGKPQRQFPKDLN